MLVHLRNGRVKTVLYNYSKVKISALTETRHSCYLQNNEQKADLMAFADKRTLNLAIYISENIVIVNIFSENSTINKFHTKQSMHFFP